MSKQVYCNGATSFVTPKIQMQKNNTEQMWFEFGSWIKSIREAARLSQAGAANRAGIDRQQWYRIENGLSGSKRETVIAMAKAVSVNIDEALTRAGFAAIDEPEHDPEGLYHGLDKLSPEMRKLAIKQVRGIMDALAEEEDPDTDYIDDEE